MNAQSHFLPAPGGMPMGPPMPAITAYPPTSSGPPPMGTPSAHPLHEYAPGMRGPAMFPGGGGGVPGAPGGAAGAPAGFMAPGTGDKYASRPKMPIIFFAKGHEPCSQLLHTLVVLNKNKMFEYCCIQEVPRQTLPSFITRVPSLWYPDTGQIIVGVDNIMPAIAQNVDTRTSQIPPSGDGAPPKITRPIEELTADAPSSLSRDAGEMSDALDFTPAPKNYNSTSKLTEGEVEEALRMKRQELDSAVVWKPVQRV